MPDQQCPAVSTQCLAVPQPYDEHDQQRNNGHRYDGQAPWEDSTFLHGPSIGQR